MDVEADTLQVPNCEPRLWELERSEEGAVPHGPPFQPDPALPHTELLREEENPLPLLQVSGQEHPQHFSRLGALYYLSAWNKSLRTIWKLQHSGGEESFAEV